MANAELLAILKQGVNVWNAWRGRNDTVIVDFSGAKFSLHEDFSNINLRNANLNNASFYWTTFVKADLRNSSFNDAKLKGADFQEAKLQGTSFIRANLSEANLTKARLTGANLERSVLKKAQLWDADLSGANLIGADLSEANLFRADLRQTDLRQADLTGATLVSALMVETQFQKANLSNCHIYGVSAWGVNLEGAIQSNLKITKANEPSITIDNLEIAQFVYLLIRNEKLRDVIDTIGKKAVLILGRFTDERKAVLDAIRDELRKRDYIPILFDFEKPNSRDVTETVVTLAHLSRFIIADLTDPRSIPHELATIVPHLRSVAIQPIILKGENPYGMFQDFRSYQWLLPTHEYETEAQLIAELGDKVIAPAEAKVNELRQVK